MPNSVLATSRVSYAYPTKPLVGLTTGADAQGAGHALDDVSLRFDHTTTLLLGPNGAGKSTLLRLLAGVMRPTSGEIFLIDTDKEENPAGPGGDTPHGTTLRDLRKVTGFVPQKSVAMASLTVREQVAYGGWLKGMSRRNAWAAAPAVLGAVGLDALSKRMARTLSGGQLRRLMLAQTLVSEPRVLLLDEPTTGLDPLERESFYELLEASGRPCIVSTHTADDVQSFFASVVMIGGGSILFAGTTKQFLARADRENPGITAAYRSVIADQIASSEQIERA